MVGLDKFSARRSGLVSGTKKKTIRKFIFSVASGYHCQRFIEYETGDVETSWPQADRDRFCNAGTLSECKYTRPNRCF